MNPGVLQSNVRREARFLILFCFLAASAAVLAKELPNKYLHQVWQAEEGIPSPIVRSVIQTQDGYIWAATQDCLTRFDGVRFVSPLDVKRGQEFEKDRQYYALTQARDGTLWTSTPYGLARQKDGATTFYTTNNGLPASYVLTVYEDRSGNIWIGSTAGLARFDKGRFISYSAKDGYFEDSVRSILEDHEGNLWVGSAKGLMRIKKGAKGKAVEQFTHESDPDLVTHNAIQCIYETKDGSLWIGTSGGLSRLKDGIPVPYSTADGLGHNTVRAVYEDKFGAIWIGGIGGVQQFIEGKFVTVATVGEMATDFGNIVPGYVYTVTGDHEGNVWIGSSVGLHRLRKQTFQTFSKAEGLLNIVTTSVLESSKGDIWVGTWGGGLSQFHDGEIKNWTTRDGLSHNFVLAICEDRDGSLWVGTDNGGLNRLRDEKFTVYNTNDYPGLMDNVIKVLFQDTKGAIWIGGPNGLSRYQDGQFTNFSKASRLPITTIKVIAEDPKHNLWVGAKEGLTCFKPEGGFKYYTENEGFTPEMVNALYADKEGAVWIGTEQGHLVRFKDDKFSHYHKTTQDALARILQILEDDSGNLWMSSRAGVFRLSKKELNDYASNLTTNISSVSYGRLDGMRRAQCNGIAQPSGWKARDGKIWFPTLAGVVAVDVKNIQPNTNPPPVVIEQILIDGKLIETSKKFLMPASAKEVEIQFSALSFRVAEKVLFRTELEGENQRWNEIGSKRSARYAHLPAGNYTFKVTACNNEGVWNQTGASLVFTVERRFTQSVPFYSLCGVIVIFLGGSLYGLRVRHLQQRQAELVKIVDERTKSLQQEITERKQAEMALLESQQMVLRQERLAAVGQLSAGVAHEFNNILTVIQGHTAFLQENPDLDDESVKSLKHISAGVERTAKLTQQMLAFSRKQIMQQQVIDLNDVIAHVVKMLGRILGENIRLTFDCDGKLPTVRADAGMVEQIIMNLSVNARDAMPKGGDLSIRTAAVLLAKLDANSHSEARPGQFVCLTVTDTGCGMDEVTMNRIFEPFFTTKEVGKGTGLGLATVYGIVKQHQGWIEVTSKPGKGTSFKIYFPVCGKPSDSGFEKFSLPRVRGGKETILVVEDESVLRELVRDILESHGYRVVEAATGAEALRLWEKHEQKIDLLFTDVVMPEGMSGRDLAAKMRIVKPGLPVVYSSGYSHEIAEHALEVRKGEAFLSKPFHPAQLAQAVRRCLDESDLIEA